MLRLVSDENFNNDIVRGLRRRQPDLDLIRLQDTEVAGADDPTVLEWAARAGRILLTHDRSTLPAFANERVSGAEPMPGVFVVNDRMPIGRAIDELLMLANCSEAPEWEGIILFLPL